MALKKMVQVARTSQSRIIGCVNPTRMARVGLIGLGLVLVGCGGSATPEPKSPEPAETSATDSAAKDDASKPSSDADEGGKSSSDSPKSDDTSSQGKGASEDELKTVLQLVIEDAELDKYLKLTEPGRFPLKMAGKDVPSGIALMKSGQPVKIFQGEPTKKDAVLVITNVEIAPPDASVGYRYDAEGIIGTAHLKKASYGWELKSSRIVEHYRSDDGSSSGDGETKKKKK
jgi:hypothetical protein